MTCQDGCRAAFLACQAGCQPGATAPDGAVRPAGRLVTLRVHKATLDQKSSRCNNDHVEEAKFDFEAVQEAKISQPG